MAYFTNFESIDYDFDGSGINRTITNLAQYSTIITKNIDDVSFYSYYNILDGERPDTVSQKLYNTPEYYWTFFIINDDLQSYWHDWPKGSEALRSFVENEYIGLAAIFEADVEAFGKFVVGGTVNGTLSNATGKVMAGHMSSTATANTILSTEVLRDPTSFGDIVRGLHVYGAKVLRDDALCSAFYTID